MNLHKLIGKLQELNDDPEYANFKKSINKIIKLLEEIERKNITDEEKDKIQLSISPYLENIQTPNNLKLGLKKSRKSLINDFGFVGSNYYLTLGVGFGLALGTSLGISFGTPFDNGIVFGPLIGSILGLIGGLIFGYLLDKKKESENKVLKGL